MTFLQTTFFKEEFHINVYKEFLLKRNVASVYNPINTPNVKFYRNKFFAFSKYFHSVISK